MIEDKKNHLFKLLKKQKAVSFEELANKLRVSKDFILGMIDSNELYRQKNGFILLSGLGVSRCIVCGDDENMEDRYTVRASIPQELLNGHKIDPSLSDIIGKYKIKGHRNCYSKIDVFFRHDSGLTCWKCSSWHGQWIDGDSVEEECHKLGDIYAGHQGVIGANKMCNFFQLSYKAKKQERKLWEKIQPEVMQRTQQEYKNLIALLEKAYLIN